MHTINNGTNEVDAMFFGVETEMAFQTAFHTRDKTIFVVTRIGSEMSPLDSVILLKDTQMGGMTLFVCRNNDGGYALDLGTTFGGVSIGGKFSLSPVNNVLLYSIRVTTAGTNNRVQVNGVTLTNVPYNGAAGEFWAAEEVRTYKIGELMCVKEMDLGEMVIYDAAITDDDMNAVNDYLIEKWGIPRTDPN
jgi:hypothetical protein